MIPGFHIILSGFHIMFSEFHVMFGAHWNYHNAIWNVTCGMMQFWRQYHSIPSTTASDALPRWS